jgi:Flp pilus assembly protein TadG
MLRAAKRLIKNRVGAVIVEFALVVPFLFLIVFGIIDFSRAYAQLNNINSSLREGARFGAAMKTPDATAIKAEIVRFSTSWANKLDTNQVTVFTNADSVVVSVTNYPISMPTLGGFLKLGGFPVSASRRVAFRWERSCPIGGCP